MKVPSMGSCVAAGLASSIAWGSNALADDQTQAANAASPSATPTSNPKSLALTEAGGPAETGVSLGVRLGYMIPIGEVGRDASLSKTFSGGVPIILDIGYRFTPNIYLGVYGQYAFAFIGNDTCGSNQSCSGKVIRLGLNVHYHIQPTETVDPWIGAGLGYEWASVSTGSSDGASVSGFEFINLQGGADYKATPAMRVGPFVSFSISQYSSESLTIGGTSQSSDIQNKSIHEWLILGLRGQYDL